MNFVKFLRTPFLTEQLWWLLLASLNSAVQFLALVVNQNYKCLGNVKYVLVGYAKNINQV